MPKETPERIIDSPYVRGATSGGGGGGGGGGTTPPPAGAPTPHDHESTHHQGLLNWGTVSKAGSSLSDLATRPHSALTGITADQHHNQVHALISSDHTATGLVVGQTVRATSATTFAWQQLQHDDLLGVLPDQHHAQIHDIVGFAHTASAPAFSLVGTTATDTLGWLTATHNPGATERILKTNNLGSLYLDTNLLYVDAANNWVGINKVPAGATLDVIASSNADHTQRIKQKSGQTGRMWRVEDLDGNELIVLDSVGNLQSGRPGFVSGLTGWQMTPQGNLEANNIWARGELHATVFVKDEVHATGGTLLVATAATVHSDAQIDSAAVDRDDLLVDSSATAFPGSEPLPLTIETTSGSFSGTTLEVEAIGNIIEINDPPSGPGLYFTPGEIIRVKTEVPTGITDLWFVVQSATQADGYNVLSVTKKSGTDSTIPKGAALVSYGHPGDGRILMTSDWRSDEGYSPYIDVFTIGASPWTASVGDIVPRMRMGQLKGVGVPGVSGISQWGMIAGSDLTNANSGYFIASNLGMQLYKSDIRLNNGTADTGLWTATGNLRIGKNIGSDATTGFRVITTNETGREGDVIVGNEATGNFLRWQQSSGILTVSGALVITDPGTTVTKSYVDSQDVAYNSTAQGYANTAQTNATNYGNYRRVVKVTGTWTSSTNVITWTGVFLTFGHSGTARAVVDGNTGSMSQRTYLYIDMTEGTMTMKVKTTEAITDLNYVLIAVCDPGNPKASVSVVAGSTYISGGNIYTDSIVAGHIRTDAIESRHINSTQVLVRHLNSETTSYIINGDTAAKGYAEDYSNRRRVVGVGPGTAWGYPINTNVITWTGLSVHFADTSTQSVTNGSVAMSGTATYYLYVNVSVATGSLTMLNTTSITALGVNDVLLATVETAVATGSGGSGYPTLMVVAGGTYISGDSIITGSIVASNISVTSLSAIDTNTGSLTVTGNLTVGNTAGLQGRIYSAGKTAYENSTAGFFLGYDIADSGYRFDIGTGTNYLRWNGTNIELKTKVALKLQAEDVSGKVLTFYSDSGGNTADLYFDYVNGFNQLKWPGVLDVNYVNITYGSFAFLEPLSAASTAKNVIHFRMGSSNPNWTALHFSGATGLLTYSHGFAAPTIYITGASSPASSAAGSPGEITWDASYIYVCVATNSWRRAALSAY